MTKPSKGQIDFEASLEAELRPIFRQFINDYKTAAHQHVPGFSGGVPAFKIVAELVRLGWRKQPT